MKEIVKKLLGGNERLWEMIKTPKFILQGIGTYLPDHIAQVLPQHQQQFSGRGVRGQLDKTDVARSCYTVWLRNIVTLYDNDFKFPEGITVAEIGPGDSLGVGMAALLSGANRYDAFDVVPTAYNYQNEEIFEELLTLFKNRAPIPDDKEFTKAIPRKLKSYDFPSHILTEERLVRSLNPERIESIRRILKQFQAGSHAARDNNLEIRYFVPWSSGEVVVQSSVDLIISCAALEHVESISESYAAAHQWLKQGGFFAHSIGLNSHQTSGIWNGHWCYSDLTWKIIRGRCTYFINRAPHIEHLQKIRESGDEVLCDLTYKRPSFVTKKDLAKRFENMGHDDWLVYETFIAGRKP